MTKTNPLRAAMLNAPQLARLSGLSVHTIRAILNEKRKRLYPETRQKLATGLRKHAGLVLALADDIEAARQP